MQVPPARVKQLTLVACILGSGVALVDSTVVNVALPAIGSDLGGGLAAQQWLSGAYLLTLGSLILVGGSLSDVLGERRVFALGVTGFGITSVLCAAAPSIELLIAARALQGVAGALLTPSALAVIISTFSEEERGPAIGSWTAWSGIATIAGPLLGGELLNIGSWRLIFLINIPLVAITLALVLAVVPARTRDTSRRVDVPGAILCALGLAGPVFALIEQPRLGWSSPGVIGPLVAGVVLLGLFLAVERRSRDPMLPLALFRRHNFAVGNIETLAIYGGLSLVFFVLVVYLQQVAGYSALKAGLSTLPTTIVMFGLSRRFGELADRFGPRLFMGAGPLVAAAGIVMLAMQIGTQVGYFTDLLPGLLVFALGLSMTVAPLTAAVLAGVDEHQAGIASAVNNAIARVAGLVATAAIGAIVASQFSSSLDSRLAGRTLTPRERAVVTAAKRQPLGVPDTRGLPPGQAAALRHDAAEASRSAFRLGMGIAAVLVATGGVLGAAGIRNPRRRVSAEDCAGGQLVGSPRDPAGCRDPVPGPLPTVARA
jgi:EmrB/QacA subfamily drug resistance transporter